MIDAVTISPNEGILNDTVFFLVDKSPLHILTHLFLILSHKKNESKHYIQFGKLQPHFFLDKAQLNNRAYTVLTVIFDGCEVAIDGFFEVESAAIDMLLLIAVGSAVDRPLVDYVAGIVESEVDEVMDVA